MNRSNTSNGKIVGGNPNWRHSAEALTHGCVSYNVKFYGDQEVALAKGTEPVKEAIRKMKFNKQLRKSEGQKVTPKVELLINVDGIALQDPKSKAQQVKFPLHHISYCADDKTEKKLFTFIAKDAATGVHRCFVLGSEKNAEEITYTIGQAFDLAYKRFLDRQGDQSGKDRQIQRLQQQVDSLEAENRRLKEKISELEGQQIYAQVIKKPPPAQTEAPVPAVSPKVDQLLFGDDFSPLPVNGSSGPISTNGTSPIAPLNPPPSRPRSVSNRSQQGFQPSTDLFGMETFNPGDVADMQKGFSAGLSMGIEDFTLESLDPLNN